MCRSVLWMGVLALVALLPVSAQQTPATVPGGNAEIEVTSVKFNTIKVPNSQGSAWYEVEIDLNAKPTTPAARFLNRVKVTINLATKTPTPGTKPPYEFYRSSAELVAVETGKATVRFYLPPEIVKRDAVRGDPDYWFVDLSVGGTAIPVTRNSTSSSISDKPKLDNFKGKVSSDGGSNDGILVPQYLSPFANDTNRQSSSFVRTEGNR